MSFTISEAAREIASSLNRVNKIPLPVFGNPFFQGTMSLTTVARRKLLLRSSLARRKSTFPPSTSSPSAPAPETKTPPTQLSPEKM